MAGQFKTQSDIFVVLRRLQYERLIPFATFSVLVEFGITDSIKEVKAYISADVNTKDFNG
ncbi:hypothetical protein OURE66S_03343 [Oligella ureolytica]